MSGCAHSLVMHNYIMPHAQQLCLYVVVYCSTYDRISLYLRNNDAHVKKSAITVYIHVHKYLCTAL